MIHVKIILTFCVFLVNISLVMKYFYHVCSRLVCISNDKSQLLWLQKPSRGRLGSTEYQRTWAAWTAIGFFSKASEVHQGNDG